MDLQHKEQTQKKHKRKKPNVSSSPSHRKDKRSRSRSERKKEKKKKQKHHQNRYLRSSSEKDELQRLRRYHKSKEKDSNKQEKYKQKQIKKESRQLHHSIDEVQNKFYKHQYKNQSQSYRKNQKLDSNFSKTGRQRKEQLQFQSKKQFHRSKNYRQKKGDQKYYQNRKGQEQNRKSQDLNRKGQEQNRKSQDLNRKGQDQKILKEGKNDSSFRKLQQFPKDSKYRNTNERHLQSTKNEFYARHQQTQKYSKYQSYRREKDREKHRSKSRDKKQFPRSPERERFSGKRRSKSKELRQDKKRADRRPISRFDGPRFRFDSPPKSDQSDMSDDPEKMEKLNRMKAQKQLVTSKADRKLYLGNLPPNITSQQLMDMLNAALKKMQINTDQQGDSIISAWISPDGVGHYAFVEFRTALQASNGLALNGASLFGYQLKLGRPKQYIEYNKQLLSKFGTDSSIDTIVKKVEAIGGQLSLEVTEKIVQPPTRILVLKHIVTVEQLAIDEEFEQIYDDVKEMAQRFGDVISIVIPRPHAVFNLEEVKTRVKGLGYIFIEYKTLQQAIFARKQLIQKQFSSRSVACSFFEEKRFKFGEYDISEKVIIDF